MRQDTTKGDGGADQGVEFLVAADGELEMARRDALYLEVLCRVAGQFEDFGGQVFEDGGYVDGGWRRRKRLGSGREREWEDENSGARRMCFFFDRLERTWRTFGANAHLVLSVVLEETLDTTTWELEVCRLVLMK